MRETDALNGARGIVIGLAISIVGWAMVGGAIYAALQWRS